MPPRPSWNLAARLNLMLGRSSLRSSACRVVGDSPLDTGRRRVSQLSWLRLQSLELAAMEVVREGEQTTMAAVVDMSWRMDARRMMVKRDALAVWAAIERGRAHCGLGDWRRSSCLAVHSHPRRLAASRSSETLRLAKMYISCTCSPRSSPQNRRLLRAVGLGVDGAITAP